MNEAYIVDAIRTPIGKTNGILKNFLPEKLAAELLKEIVERSNLQKEDIEQVILGNVVGTGGNIARLSLLEADFPITTPAMTIDTQCSSALSSIQVATGFIASGQADLLIVGGMESTSMSPKRQFNKKDPRFTDENTYYEQAPFSSVRIGNPVVGWAAEDLAKKLDIKREDMDKWALNSHLKAVKTKQEGLLKDVIKPLVWEDQEIKDDECIRSNMTIELLSRMPASFSKNGAITAGNTCLKHDGAAVVLLASKNALKKFNLKAKAVIKDNVSVGCDPNFFPLAPVGAIDKILKKHDLSLQDIDFVEINEAFAVKILACCKQLTLPLEKVNVIGGALAYGHPYGASGVIILVHLLKALDVFNKKRGIASIGAVGGLGNAILVERL